MMNDPADLVCADCGTDVGVAVYRLCQPCRHTRLVAERAQAGLEPTITDATVAARLARVLGLAS